MIDTKITLDDREIIRALNRLTGNTINSFWYKVATALFSKVIRNIQIGVDVDGKPFKDYTANYKSFKTKKGLSLVVNLQYSSQMVKSITIMADEKGFAIFISGAYNNRKAEWNQLKNGRRFLDWGTDLENEFYKIIRYEMNNILR